MSEGTWIVSSELQLRLLKDNLQQDIQFVNWQEEMQRFLTAEDCKNGTYSVGTQLSFFLLQKRREAAIWNANSFTVVLNRLDLRALSIFPFLF